MKYFYHVLQILSRLPFPTSSILRKKCCCNLSERRTKLTRSIYSWIIFIYKVFGFYVSEKKIIESCFQKGMWWHVNCETRVKRLWIKSKVGVWKVIWQVTKTIIYDWRYFCTTRIMNSWGGRKEWAVKRWQLKNKNWYIWC